MTKAKKETPEAPVEQASETPAEIEKTSEPQELHAGFDVRAILTIAAKREGFRRCGMAHSATATDHPAERFSLEEIAILEADPMLLVSRRMVEVPVEAGE